MSQKTSSIRFVFLVLTCFLVVTAASNTSAQAESIQIGGSEDKCISCHENLYFLHDTGNWFCLRESPMHCVDCHGGDPEAGTQELAHSNRAAHPIINEDISKCHECHPGECDERVAKFDRVAGIGNVLVAAPYQPRSVVNSEEPKQGQPSEAIEYLGWPAVMEIITPSLILGLALVIFLVHQNRQNKSRNRSHK